MEKHFFGMLRTHTPPILAYSLPCNPIIKKPVMKERAPSRKKIVKI